MRKTAFLLLLSLWALSPMGAQSHYTVQLGAFINARSSDFDAIRRIGFVYAESWPDNSGVQVFLGGYGTAEEAEAIAREARQQGYANATVQARAFSAGQPAIVNQIAIRDIHRPIEWERFLEVGNLLAVVEGNRIRILTGIYPGNDAAREALNSLRAKGYSDAFTRSVSTAQLIAIGSFETGAKQPLIPINLGAGNEQSPPATTARSVTPAPTTPAPTTYDATNYDAVPAAAQPQPAVTPRSPIVPEGRPVAESSRSATQLPKIRGNVKRRSALDLQTLMKSAGYYQSSLDGLYGSGTASAYQSMLNGNRELNKYRLLAQYLPAPSTTGVSDPLQEAINDLPGDAGAGAIVDGSRAPIALAYQAYRQFISGGPSARVNSLMNQAIAQAYGNKPLSSQPPFDYRATYAYESLGQLVLHLHYIHLAPGNAYALPCWLAGLHPAEAANAREAVKDYAGGNLLFQACDPFMEWPEVKLLYTIAADLNDDPVFDPTRLSSAASTRSQLYLADDPLTDAQQAATEVWRQKLLDNLNIWATRDPLHQRMATALKAAFFQSQVRLEDYYLDQEFNAEEAKGLALATLQTVVNYHLRRFAE